MGGSREFRVGGLRRLRIRMLEGVAHLGRRSNPVPGQDGLSIAKRGGVSERWTGADDRRVIAGNVGNQQRHDSRRSGMECQPASLHRGQVLPDAVHFVDGRAGSQQRGGDLLLVRQGDTGGRSGQQGARPARNQAEQEIVRTKGLGLLQEASGGHLSCLVGNRMGRFDDLDPRAADAVAIRRDRQPAERRVPCLVRRSRHDRRCLAGTQNQGASARPAGQMPDDKLLRVSGIDDRVEHLPKRGPMPRVGVPVQRSVYRGAGRSRRGPAFGRAHRRARIEAPAVHRAAVPGKGVPTKYRKHLARPGVIVGPSCGWSATVAGVPCAAACEDTWTAPVSGPLLICPPVPAMRP